MVSLLSSLNIAANALNVNESALSVVSHNVANMNTEGYSKQNVNLATRNISGAIGNNVESQIRSNGGVMIASVTRSNNEYLNRYYRDQLSIQKQYEQQIGNLEDLADIFNDLDGTGLTDSLSAFYEAVNNLNEYPASVTARTNFIESAKTLTSLLNSKSSQLSQMTTKVLGDGESEELLQSSQIYSEYQAFNDKLSELAAVNKSLQVTQTGTLEANNLLDKRDKILSEIAEYVNINTEEKANGSVNLYIGDIAVVRGADVTGTLNIQTAKSYCNEQGIVYPDDWDGQAAVFSIVDQKGNKIVDNANDIIKSGSLGGMIHSADTDTDKMNAGKALEYLNNIASTIAQVFNDINTDVAHATDKHAFCIDPTDTSKLIATTDYNYIFVDNAGGTGGINAANIQVNPDLLTDDGCWNIACAYFDDLADFDERAVGNAQNVVKMLATRSDKQISLGNMTIEDYYTALIGKIASSGSNVQTLYDTQTEVVESVHNQMLANNSVDLNEELVDMVKYQTAYSASAKVFNVANECLGILMTLGS